MNFKVSNTQEVKKSSKKIKVKASKVESLGFANALHEAQSVEDIASIDNVENINSIQSVFVNTNSLDEVPEKAKERGYYILDLLEELEKDILLGKGTSVSQKLENALNTQAKDINNLPEVVKDLMQEIELRAALELEKIKQYNKI